MSHELANNNNLETGLTAIFKLSVYVQQVRAQYMQTSQSCMALQFCVGSGLACFSWSTEVGRQSDPSHVILLLLPISPQFLYNPERD